jgi:hypothetical protein
MTGALTGEVAWHPVAEVARVRSSTIRAGRSPYLVSESYPPSGGGHRSGRTSPDMADIKHLA